MPTKRGGRVLMFHGYKYHADQYTANGKIRWRCHKRKLNRCHGLLVTLDYQILQFIEHNH